MSVPILDPDYPPDALWLHPDLWKQPTHVLSKAHRQSLREVAQLDPKAHAEGLDWKSRPVVYGKGPNGQHRRYSLLKNGSATPVTYANGRSKQLAEVW